MSEVNVLPGRSTMGQAAAAAAAGLLRQALERSPTVRVIFAAAPSQQETLAALTKERDVDWSRVDAFHMDEYLGLPSDHPSAFANWLRAHLFDHVQLHSVNLIRPGSNPGRTASDYAALLDKAPVDLVLSGIGENGHIAFNDPPTADFHDPLDAKIVELDTTCRQQQVDDGQFARIEEVPTHAITLTVPRLMRSKAIVCVVPGASKRQAVTASLTGPVTPRWPASILQTHPNAKIFLDLEAGADVAASV